MALFFRKKGYYDGLLDSVEAVVKKARVAIRKEDGRFGRRSRIEQQTHGYATDANVATHYGETANILRTFKMELLTEIGLIDKEIKNIQEAAL